jgi:hypothetical protein
MTKGKVARLAGFIGALGVSTVLVTTAVQGTGAYFTDSEAGNLTVTSGSLTLSITNGTTTALNFTGVMPGVENYQNQSVDYEVGASDGKVDLWLTFDPNTTAYQTFTGGKDSPHAPDGGLGAYGYFKVADSAAGDAFQSGNLAFSSGANDPTDNGCTTTSVGRGGSPTIVADDGSNNNAVPYCGVPAQILLRGGMTSGDTGSVTVTFGLDGYKNSALSDQNKTQVNVPFKLVATQAGHRP